MKLETGERLFKVRRKSDGLFAVKQNYGIGWSPQGSFWKGTESLRQSLLNGPLRHTELKDIDILEYKAVLEEVGIAIWPTFKVEEP